MPRPRCSVASVIATVPARPSPPDGHPEPTCLEGDAADSATDSTGHNRQGRIGRGWHAPSAGAGGRPSRSWEFRGGGYPKGARRASGELHKCCVGTQRRRVVREAAVIRPPVPWPGTPSVNQCIEPLAAPPSLWTTPGSLSSSTLPVLFGPSGPRCRTPPIRRALRQRRR